MPTEIYKTRYIHTFDGVELEIIPLRIKYLKELLNVFALVEYAKNEEETLNILSECARIALKQYCPELSKDVELVQDSFDLKTIYDLLNYSANLKLNGEAEEPIMDQAKKEGESTTWDTLDLAKLESEVFLLGIWKNFDELESSISLEEIMKILSITRELSFEERKFTAALQGVDLEGGEAKEDGQKKWEDMKARVFSGGTTADSNDILALQGVNAQKAGFGIGLGLDFEDLRDPSVML